MKTIEGTSVDPDVVADGQAIVEMLSSGKPLDPETYKRIKERGQQITEDLRTIFGEREIAVDLIRSVRDEE